MSMRVALFKFLFSVYVYHIIGSSFFPAAHEVGEGGGEESRLRTNSLIGPNMYNTPTLISPGIPKLMCNDGVIKDTNSNKRNGCMFEGTSRVLKVDHERTKNYKKSFKKSKKGKDKGASKGKSWDESKVD